MALFKWQYSILSFPCPLQKSLKSVTESIKHKSYFLLFYNHIKPAVSFTRECNTQYECHLVEWLKLFVVELATLITVSLCRLLICLFVHGEFVNQTLGLWNKTYQRVGGEEILRCGFLNLLNMGLFCLVIDPQSFVDSLFLNFNHLWELSLFFLYN